MKARLIIADDHQVLRQGLRDIISRTADMKVVGEAADGVAAEHLARNCEADLMVLDIALPQRRGIQVLESLRSDGVMLPILLFSMYPASQYVDYVRRAGAQGFLSKDADGQEVIQAIRRILAGRSNFPGGRPVAATSSSTKDPFALLSRRELEVMQALASGAAVVDIAAELGVSTQTVSTYRRRLLEKLGLKSNAELAILATRHSRL